MLGLLDRSGKGCAINDVAGHDQRPTSLLFHSSLRVLEPFARRHVEQRHVGAGLGEADRNALPDTASGAGHKGDFVLEAEQTHFEVSQCVRSGCCQFHDRHSSGLLAIEDPSVAAAAQDHDAVGQA